MMIYVVRHGEIPSNVDGIVNARNNQCLTDRGIAQCEQLFEKYRNIKFDVCFTSNFNRTIATAEIITKKRCPIIVTDLLQERDCGGFEGRPESDFPDDYFSLSKNLMIVDGESMQEFVDRVHSFLKCIIEERKYEAILISTHSGVCRAIKLYFDNVKFNDFRSVEINNCDMQCYFVETCNNE